MQRNSHIAADRAELRAAMRAGRQALPKKDREAFSLLACAHILKADCWRDAAAVALYMAVRGETDTRPLLEAAWGEDKTVLLPLCSRDEAGHMRLIACRGYHALRPGPFSIPEPVADDRMYAAQPAVPDLIIVPGLAFDHAGNRLGMGGGYYDRLLSRPEYNRTLRVGLAYSFQLVPSLPIRAWDYPMHAVCTEQSMTWMNAT